MTTEDERTMPPAGERLLAETAWLHALARSLVADRDVAEDVAQQTLLVAWQRRLCAVGELRPWLATVARNLARRFARSEQRRRRHEGGLPPRGDEPAAADVVAKAAMQRDVVDAALRLPEPYRTTLLLRFQEDLGYAQIASRTGVPIETVRTRIKRALQQLRVALDARHGGSSRAWAVPILGVTGFDNALALAAPAAATGAAGGAVATAGAGVLLMSLHAKMATAAAAMAAAAFLTWQLWPGEARMPHPDGTGTDIAAAAARTERPGSPATPTATDLRDARTEVSEPGPSSPRPAPGGEGRWLLTGRVVDDTSLAPVAGARLALVPPRGSAVEVGITDEQGRYCVPLRATIQWELRASHDRYAPAFVSLDELVRSIQRHQHEPDAPDRHDLGDVRLSRGQTVTGRVLAADGRSPIVGASILQHRAAYGLAIVPFMAPPVATSAADGSFALPGRHAPGHCMQYVYAVAPSGVGWCTLQVSHREGAAAPHDIVLREPAFLDVEVVDAGGAPVHQAVVTAIPLFQPLGMAPILGRPFFANPPAPFVAQPDGGGRAAFDALPTGDDGLQHGRPVSGGSYMLHVFAPSHRHTYAAASLAPGVRARQRIVLVAIDASVRVRGDVRDTAGLPVAGAAVTFEGVAGGPRAIPTETDGTFVCEDVRSHHSVVQVVVRAAGHVTVRREIELGGGPEQRLHFELARAMPIRGRVVDQDGRPVANAPVYLDGDVANLDDHLLADADGRFAFENAPPGEHPLLVIACPDEQVFDPVRLVVDNTTEPQEIEVRMRRVTTPLATVELTIVESAGGRPLEPSMAALAPVDEQGRLRGVMVPLSPFTGGARASDVPPGRYQLHVGTNDGHRCTRPFEVPAGVPVVREHIALDAPATVAVTVDLSAVPAVARPQQLRVELQPWDAGRFGDRNRKDVGDRRTAWFCVDLERGDGFDVVDLTPGVDCTLIVREAGFAGELQLRAQPGSNGTATLHVRPR